MGNFIEVVKFSKEFIFHPVSVSSIIPSSKSLSYTIVSMSNLKSKKVIFEFGCGTGAITEAIVKRINGNAKIFSFDMNDTFIEIIKNKYPQVIAINDSVENTRKYMKEYFIDSVDVIISSLPWAAFDDILQKRLLNITYDILTPGGEFLTYSYIHTRYMTSHKRFIKILKNRFGGVTVSPIIWNNIPPAFIIKCKKD